MGLLVLFGVIGHWAGIHLNPRWLVLIGWVKHSLPCRWCWDRGNVALFPVKCNKLSTAAKPPLRGFICFSYMYVMVFQRKDVMAFQRPQIFG